MWQDRSPIFWTRLIAVVFVTTGQLLHADDQPASSDGYKTIPVTIAGGKTMPVRVKDGNDPFKNVSSSNSTGKYDPSSLNFSATSSMANKTYSPPSNSISKSNSDLKNQDQHSFITKAYVDNALSRSAPNLNNKAALPATSAYSRNATGFDKSFATSNADAGQNRMAVLASAKSPDQDRTAPLGTHTTAAFASTLTGKTFEGPEADAAHHHLTKTDDGRIVISDLPNRALTIDEVRNLINHGFKPNTDLKPEEPSKPLNDPNYKPEPLRDTPSPALEDDKNDPIPSPGTMAAPQPPENSEPLPQP